MKGLVGLLVLIIGLQVLFQSVSAQVCPQFCTDCCGLQYKFHGCYKYPKHAPSPKHLLLDETSTFGPPYPDAYMLEFICRCARAATEEGYKYFGIQNYGKCWAGNTWDIPDTSNSTKKPPKCKTCDLKTCVPNPDKYCIGKKKSIFMYELAQPCEVKVKYIGCFKDKPKKNRALKNYTLTGRQNLKDRVATVGRIEDSDNWRNYNWWLPMFACECARQAYAMGREYFGLQFWGECWIGSNKQETPADYAVYGESERCNDNCFDKCKEQKCGIWCVGEHWTNAVYKIVSPPKK